MIEPPGLHPRPSASRCWDPTGDNGPRCFPRRPLFLAVRATSQMVLEEMICAKAAGRLHSSQPSIPGEQAALSGSGSADQEESSTSSSSSLPGTQATRTAPRRKAVGKCQANSLGNIREGFAFASPPSHTAMDFFTRSGRSGCITHNVVAAPGAVRGVLPSGLFQTQSKSKSERNRASLTAGKWG